MVCVLGQLWKIDADKKLRNMKGNFEFGDKEWTVPNTGDKGFIENSNGLVLTVDVNGVDFSVTDKRKAGDGHSTQMWFRSRSTIDGYFLLENGELQGYFLTDSRTDGKVVVHFIY